MTPIERRPTDQDPLSPPQDSPSPPPPPPPPPPAQPALAPDYIPGVTAALAAISTQLNLLVDKMAGIESRVTAMERPPPNVPSGSSVPRATTSKGPAVGDEAVS